MLKSQRIRDWLTSHRLPTSSQISTTMTSPKSFRLPNCPIPSTPIIANGIVPLCGGGGSSTPFGGNGSVSGSGAGTYIQEPSDPNYRWFNQPNWCGAGSSTSVLLHWGYNAVTTAGPYSVPVDPQNNTLFNANYGTSGQGYVHYAGPLGYMSWLATGVFSDSTGVVTLSWNSSHTLVTGEVTNIYTQANGLNQALADMGYGGYYYGKNYASNAESWWIGDAQYDIGHDHHPMIIRGNAADFSWWQGNLGGQNPLNHVVMNYGYDSGGFSVADTASWQDGSSISGDHYSTYANLWLAETSATDGAYVDY